MWTLSKLSMAPFTVPCYLLASWETNWITLPLQLSIWLRPIHNACQTWRCFNLRAHVWKNQESFGICSTYTYNTDAFWLQYMSYGRNLVHGERTSQNRVGPYRFCSGGTPPHLSSKSFFGFLRVYMDVYLLLKVLSSGHVQVHGSYRNKGTAVLFLRQSENGAGSELEELLLSDWGAGAVWVLQSTTTYYSVLQSTTPVLPCTTHYYHASHWYPFCCRHPSAIKVRYWDSKTFKGYDSWMGDWLPRAIFWILGYRSGIVRGIVRIPA